MWKAETQTKLNLVIEEYSNRVEEAFPPTDFEAGFRACANIFMRDMAIEGNHNSANKMADWLSKMTDETVIHAI